MSFPLPPTAVSALFLALNTVAQSAPVLAPRYTVRDAGQVRSFEMAMDELSVRRGDGMVVTEKSGAATMEGLTGAMKARRISAAAADTVDVVLYESGRPRGQSSRRWATPGVLVTLENGTDAAGIAARAGAASWKPAPAVKGAVILTFSGGGGAALTGTEALRTIKGVQSAEPLLARQHAKRWVPNDPFFAYNAANAGYQWHLKNTGQNGGVAGIDINVTGVWDTWRGSGIRIGIIDDGLQTSHPDLSPNADTVNDYDWNGADNDPSPTNSDTHGSSCAGVAAGRGNNGIGICGAAPEATLVGLRLIAGPDTDEMQAGAFLHHNDIIQVKSNSWGPDDDGNTVEGPDVLAAAALAEGASSGRGGLGTVVLWAGGNGLEFGDDANYDGYANSIYVIATGALTDRGEQANYSESGANLLITAPSSGDSSVQGISTTDLVGVAGYNSGSGGNFANGDYTNDFGGTSSASPLAAGAVALVLQSKPGLGWRDVQEILIRSATKVDAAGPGWFNNAAGFHFNNKYGAGLINAQAAVNLAATWTNLDAMASHTAGAPGAVAIPDNSTAGAVKTFTQSASNFLRVEHAAVMVDITHARRGQLAVQLVSPSGTVCELAHPRPDSTSGLVWAFTTPQFWGETSTGTWTLRVMDTVSGSTGMLNSASLTLYGTGIPGVPVITSSGSTSGLTGSPFNFQPAATNSPTQWSATLLPPGLTINGGTGLISGTPTTTGVFSGELTASNKAGSGSTSLTITVTAPPPGITDALEAPSLIFSSVGTPWFSETSTTHDGVDAAQSGTIPSNGSSGLQTTVTGPITVDFWWQVSSEEGFDKLRFSVDGAEQQALSGSVTWTQVAAYIPGGTHTLRWTYDKDESGTSGLDAGWLDTISFHSSIVPLKPGGASTGFQEPALDATSHLHTTGSEIGWIASGGRVAESGNRNPPLTGAATGGTQGVKSFEINDESAELRTDIIDLAGFLNVTAEASVRTYTTSGTNFETPDRLHIYLEISNDLTNWTSGPDILAQRTGGTGTPPDTLIPLNTSGNGAYNAFVTPAGAIPAGTRYARIVVNGVTDGPSEHLVIDNLRVSGTESNVDADGDGYPLEVEAWFGTSDNNPDAAPAASINVSAGASSISFPSLPGYTYAVDASEDLHTWTTVMVTATSISTLWADPAGTAARNRYYRVRRP